MTLRIKDLRQARGLSQVELGAMVGLSGAAISRMESGEAEAIVKLQGIATALGVQPSDLFDTTNMTANDLAQMFLSLPPEDRAAIIQMMRSMSQSAAAAPRRG